MLIDTHCHLHREEFDSDRREVVDRAFGAGVEILVDPATDAASNRKVIQMTRDYPHVYAAVGIHPHDAAQLSDGLLKELTFLSKSPKVVAIGEIGLDYYRNLSPREVQQEALRKLLRLAGDANLPVILHCRGEKAVVGGLTGSGDAAYRDLFRILQEERKPPIHELLHCFSGDHAVAKEGMEMGLTLSFAGNLTFAKAEALRAVAGEVPSDRVVLETDAPFLAPQTYRGKRNEPVFLSELVKSWAQIRDVSVEEVAHSTTENAQRLFRFPA